MQIGIWLMDLWILGGNVVVVVVVVELEEMISLSIKPKNT